MILIQEKEDLVEYSFLFILGAAFGSFLNVVIIRTNSNKSIIKPCSQTLCCKKNIKFYHNIPILSYILLRGKCAYCKESFSINYFFVELIAAICTVLIVYKNGFTYESLFLIGLFYNLIVLSFIDFKFKAVPDYFLLSALVLAFIASYDNIIESFTNAFLFAGAISLLSFVLTFYIQNIKVRFTKNDDLKTQEALGEGDIPIIAIIGIILGVKAGLVAIFLASILAILPSIYSNIKKNDLQTPFIPFLSLGMFLEFIFSFSKVL